MIDEGIGFSRCRLIFKSPLECLPHVDPYTSHLSYYPESCIPLLQLRQSCPTPPFTLPYGCRHSSNSRFGALSSLVQNLIKVKPLESVFNEMIGDKPAAPVD